MSARCRGCGAEVLWRKTPAGRYLGLDPPRRSLRLIATIEATDAERATLPRRTIVTAEGRTLVGFEAPMGSNRGTPTTGHVAHWATCPMAREFRKTETPS